MINKPLEVNINDSNIKIVYEQNVDILWTLYQAYHDEVSNYNSEQSLPLEVMFKSYWCRTDKLGLILYSGRKAIGFALLQKIDALKNYATYIEVGAIFVKKDFRKGLCGVRLYQIIFDIGNQLSLPIASEVAEANNLSLKLARLLALRYIKHKGKGNLYETKLKNGRYFIRFSIIS